MKQIPEISREVTDRLPYMPQLNGLRALAVTFVIIHYYTKDGWGFGAQAGVNIFFIISGFLITK
jgi:peptidoglycan/LPS O-acetylase OafA/YrhL